MHTIIFTAWRTKVTTKNSKKTLFFCWGGGVLDFSSFRNDKSTRTGELLTVSFAAGDGSDVQRKSTMFRAKVRYKRNVDSVGL